MMSPKAVELKIKDTDPPNNAQCPPWVQHQLMMLNIKILKCKMNTKIVEIRDMYYSQIW